jgi:regulator of cell morphogenesis and NO signaling
MARHCKWYRKYQFLPGTEMAMTGTCCAPNDADTPASTAEEPAPDETGALIDHILARFHATHRRDLPGLVALARRVERVHAGSPGTPAGLADLLEEMEAELADHMAKEEQVLFPMMRRGGHPMIAMPIGMMRHEHEGHLAHLGRLAALTHGHAPPDGACGSWRALYAGTRSLADDLVEHMRLENDILLPRFGA